MGVYHPTSVTCACGTTFPAHVAHTLNARRTPTVRARILDGSFHRVVCPGCRRALTIERPMSYVDPDRNAIFLVKPRGSRVDYRGDSKRLAKVLPGLPARLSRANGRQARVVYGLDELREKLVAQDLELDDRVLELLKILVVYEHPFLLRRARLQLFLVGTHGKQLRFVAYHHNRSEAWEASFPVSIVDDLKGRERELREWVKRAHARAPLFSLPDHWVNFRRWTLRYDPLDSLRTFAKGARDGKSISLTSQDFTRMLARLPRGNQLPGWAKQDLRTLFEHARSKRAGKAQDLLTQVRFGIELDDEWAYNEKPSDIDTIWQLLESVPVTNVEGNTRLREIQLTDVEGGAYGGGVIEIGEGELGSRERFEDTLRHEVGHAVHEERDALITPWLERRFGWRVFPPTPAGIDQWVRLMGGWGAVSDRERKDIVQALETAVREGEEWGPGTPPRFPRGHPWHSDDFGPRLAYAKSGEEWWRRFRTWHRSGGRAFFVNFYYAELMAVSADTLDRYVARMPSSYAAMSPFEFFAELYALYYDRDDPLRDVIAKDAEIAGWLDRNVGRRNPRKPQQPGRAGGRGKKRARPRRRAR